MFVKLNKRIGNYSKFTLQFITGSKPLFSPCSVANFSLTRDLNLISQKRDFMVNKVLLKETSRESVKKGIEQIYNDILQHDKNTQVTKALRKLNEQYSNLRFTSDSVDSIQEHLKFILEKGIQSLKENYSQDDLLELMRFCDIFQVNDPILYTKISRIAKSNINSLGEKLKIMCEFDYVLPLVQIEDLPSIDSLQTNERIYLFYLTKVRNYFNEDVPDFSEIQSKMLDTVQSKIQNEKLKPNQLRILFSILDVLQRTSNTNLVSISKDISQVMDALEKNFKYLSNKQLIQIYTVIHQSDLDLNKSQNTVVQLTKLIDERIPEMKFHEIRILISSLQSMNPKLNTNSFINEADKLLITSITMNVLSDKGKVLLLDSQIISNMLDIHSRWQVWNATMNEIFVTLSIALFEVKRLKAHNFIRIVVNLAQFNKGIIPAPFLALLRIRTNIFMTETKLENLLDLYQVIKGHSETAKTYENGILEQLSKMVNDPSPQNLYNLFNKKMFLFFLQHLHLFDTNFTQSYVSRLEKYIQQLSPPQILSMYLILTKDMNPKFLLEDKGQSFLFVFEKYISTLFPQLSPQLKQNYIQMMSHLLLKIQKLKEKRKDLELFEPQNYPSLKNNQNIVIPINLSILKDQITFSTDALLETSKTEVNDMNKLLLMQQSLATGNKEASDKVLTNMCQNLKENKINIQNLVQVLRTSQDLRTQFKENFIDKDPEIKKLLLKALYKELDKEATPFNQDPSSSGLKSESHNLFVFVNFLLAWNFPTEELKMRLYNYIRTNIDSFVLDDILLIISFGNNIFKTERKILYDQIMGRLGRVVFQEKVNYMQAYNLLMAFNFNMLEEKTFFELEKIIAENFVRYKIQEIVKLVEKFERNHRKSTKIFWNVLNYYFNQNDILNLDPLQLRIFTQVLIKENYGSIFESVLYYLKNNTDLILKDKNLAQVLFYCSQLPDAKVSEEFISLCKGGIEKLSTVSNLGVLLYLLASSPQETLPQDQLRQKWEEILSKAQIREVSQASIALGELKAQTNFIEIYPWILDSIFGYVVKERENKISYPELIIIYSSLNNDSTALKNHSEIISNLIPVFLNQVHDPLLISKFTSAWARSLTNNPDEEIIKLIRGKIVKINPIVFLPHNLVLNFLEAVIEMDKFKRENHSKLLNRGDFSLLNRLENIVFSKASIYKREELAEIYEFYVENKIGSNRMLEFLEKKLV